MIVEEFTERNEKSWDDFVARNKNTTFFHQTGWKKLIEKCYAYKPIYLIAREKEAIRGILPLFLVNHIFLGKRLLSLPFSTLGGICTDNPIARDMLLAEALRITKSYNCKYLELRNLEEINNSNLLTRSNYYTFRLALNSDPQILWQNLRKTNRRYIRKAKDHNLNIILDSGNFDIFYRIFSQSQRDMGTPIQPYKWLENLYYDFPDNHFIPVIEYKGKIIAVYLFRYFKNTVYWIFGYSPKEYLHLYPNYIMLWNLIEDACARGYHWFDFGRSVAASGTYSFKAGWQAEPVNIYYQYHLNNSSKILDTSQESKRRQQFAHFWRKFPLPVANRVGPIIRNYFP